jgi:putative flavoprotein involved in K+ transport
MTATANRAEVIVIGGGQAGMTAGYYLARAGIDFLILDAAPRAGQSWRQRWD